MKPRAYYQPISPGLLLARPTPQDATAPHEHLRHWTSHQPGDLYRRTVDEFLLQLAVNDAPAGLRSRKDMVIHPSTRGGALIREDWHWSLLFTPNRSEKRTLDDSSDLYQVLAAWLSAGRTVRSAGWRCPTGA